MKTEDLNQSASLEFDYVTCFFCGHVQIDTSEVDGLVLCEKCGCLQ